MKNIRVTLLVASLLFFPGLSAVGCAQNGSETMDGERVQGRARATFEVR